MAPVSKAGLQAASNATALARAKDAPDAGKLAPRQIALEVVRASGLGLLTGRVLLPTARMVALARQATAKVKVLESIDLSPGDGDVRIHLVLAMMGDTTRVVVRGSIASFYLSASGGALRLRLLESPQFAGKHGGKTSGVLGLIGAFGEAALSSMGPEGIATTVARFLGPPLSAQGDVLSIDLSNIPALRTALRRETAFGLVGDLLRVTGANFRPKGLELSVDLRPRAAVSTLLQRARSKLPW